jgi:hypothetical protein
MITVVRFKRQRHCPVKLPVPESTVCKSSRITVVFLSGAMVFRLAMMWSMLSAVASHDGCVKSVTEIPDCFRKGIVRRMLLAPMSTTWFLCCAASMSCSLPSGSGTHAHEFAIMTSGFRFVLKSRFKLSIRTRRSSSVALRLMPGSTTGQELFLKQNSAFGLIRLRCWQAAEFLVPRH